MDPILTELMLFGGPRPIGTYGLFLALGGSVGALMALRGVARVGLDTGKSIAVLALTIGAGIGGAYALFALVSWVTTGTFDPTRQGGLVFYGALFGGGLALVASARAVRAPILELTDAITPALAVGHALGRIGCFLGGCCYGRETELPFGVVYDSPHGYFVDNALRHPVPLYESAFLLGLASLLLWVRPSFRRPGARTAVYLGAYAAGRFLLEWFRGDEGRGLFGGLSTSQILATAIAVAVIVAWLSTRGWGRRFPRTVRGAASVSLFLSVSVIISPALGQLRTRTEASEAPQAAASRRAHPTRLSNGERHALVMSLPNVITIEGGWFFRGSSESDVRRAIELCLLEHRFVFAGFCLEEEFVDEQPRRRIYVSRFAIDRTEVTNDRYRACVATGACRPSRVSPADRRLAEPTHPVTGVTWTEAHQYCRFVGGRLPTEAEWEKAARGVTARTFPWGKVYNDRLANHGKAGFVSDGVDGYRYAGPVGSFPDGASPYGLVDMAGNVWEWTADRYRLEWYLESPSIDPKGPASGGDRVVRGGSWRYPPHGLRVTHRRPMPEGLSAPDVGFRCVYDVP